MLVGIITWGTNKTKVKKKNTKISVETPLKFVKDMSEFLAE